MKKNRWQILLITSLLLVSTIFYLIHYFVFNDVHHILVFFIGELAFLPLEVLLVTLVIHKLLDKKEKSHFLNKLNMVIGAFFSDMGADLLRLLVKYDTNHEQLQKLLNISDKWTKKDYFNVLKILKNRNAEIKIDNNDLQKLTDFFTKYKRTVLRMLENQNLLEHQSFTDLLWAVSHLIEELQYRKDFESLPESDIEHLAGDINRVYSAITFEWVNYMMHLSCEYPYLFSLSARTNPFKKNPDSVVY